MNEEEKKEFLIGFCGENNVQGFSKGFLMGISISILLGSIIWIIL